MKHFALILLLALFSGFALSQECPYDPDLDWDDFREVPDDPNNDHDAVTSSGASAEWEITLERDGDQVKAKVKAKAKSTFYKDGSTVEKGAKTPELLQHEQYHLDISEYWARQIEEALNGIEQNGANAQDAADLANAEAARIMDQMLSKCDDFQEQYDEETDHSRNKKKQAEWCKKIEALLKTDKVETPKSTGEKTGMNYNPEDGSIWVDESHLASFSFNNLPFMDPIFHNASVIFPPMFYGGERMGIPYFATLPYEDMVSIVSQDGLVLMQGVIRIMTGDVDGTTYTAWLSWLDSEQQDGSSFQDAIVETAGSGRGVMAISLVFDAPPAEVTGQWTWPAVLEPHVQLGVTRATNPCDVNCDGKVDFEDQDALMAILSGDAVACSFNGGDLNGDGMIGEEDYFLLEACIMNVPPVGIDLQMKRR